MMNAFEAGHPDVAVIGGGIVGASVAYHIARLGRVKTVLLEREDLLGTGSTGRCAGGFRHQFSSEINIRLSLESVRMIRAFAEEPGFEIDVHQDGYLFLLSRPRDLAAFEKNVALQNSLGVQSRILPPAEISRLAPHLQLDGVLAGAYCAADGIADPSGMTHGYASAARRLGVEIRTGIEATGFSMKGERIEAVETSAGRVSCGAVVNAAGPHAREVAAWAGLDLPVHPERRHVYATYPFAGAPLSHLMVIDYATTFYFHRESGGVLMGMGPRGEPAGATLEPDPGFLEKVLGEALRIYPALAGSSLRRSWTGLYEMSPDAHPILGSAGQVPNLYLANGFSGHGFQHAPVAGKLVAEEIIHGRAGTIDISRLRLDRFHGGEPAAELSVI